MDGTKRTHPIKIPLAIPRPPLRTDGLVKYLLLILTCWLAFTTASTPAYAATGATVIAEGGTHSCAIVGGNVKCWGNNAKGQLGNGTTSSASTPVTVLNVSGATAITAGYSHSCALVSGAVQCWGYNADGELGNVSKTNASSPVNVFGISAATGLSTSSGAGYHTCAIISGGLVQCWGLNDYGQLGNGTLNASSSPVTVSGISGATAVAVGRYHSCAILSGGAMKCWGYNLKGELGNGATSTQAVSTPVSVNGISGATAVAVGDDHFTCAVVNGAVMCWGYNSYGQLGNGSKTNSLAPVMVSNISGATSVAATLDTGCALMSSGLVQCWGYNYGLIGSVPYTTSTPVSILTGATAFSAGGIGGNPSYNEHACVIVNGGGVQCLGDNTYGELGNGVSGSSQSTTSLVSVVGIAPVLLTSVGITNSAGSATLASGASLTFAATANYSDGSSKPISPTWTSSNASLGVIDSTGKLTALTVSANTPITITATYSDGGVTISQVSAITITPPVLTLSGLTIASDIATLSSGGSVGLSTTATYNNGTSGVVTPSWSVSNSAVASINSSGVLSAATVAMDTPITVTASYTVGNVTQTATFNLTIKAAVATKTLSSLMVIGGATTVNSSGTLGFSASAGFSDGSSGVVNPNWSVSNPAVASINSSGVLTALSVSSDTLVTVTAVYTVGNVTQTATFNLTIKAVVQANPVKAAPIAAGYGHTCNLGSGGTVQCWGYNGSGQLGNGTTLDAAGTVTVSGLVGAVGVATGNGHSCALLNSGAVKCWGDNSYGQLGIAAPVSSSTPVAVNGISGATAIVAGDNHTCAIISGGTVQCWGYNNRGQLGMAITTPSTFNPMTVPGISGATALAAGVAHSCAVVDGGAVQCWGGNAAGQLGNGATIDSYLPVAVSGISGATAIAADGNLFTCALLGNATVKCWGDNAYGQLGNGTTTASTTPVSVAGLSGATAIAAGFGHACAVVGNGAVQCWGLNVFGELGNGTKVNASTPVAVTGLSGAVALAADNSHSCALLGNNAVQCWGANANGRLGNGTTTDAALPVTVISQGALPPTPFSITGTAAGPITALSLNANITVASSDMGAAGFLYIAAIVPNAGLFVLAQTASGLSWRQATGSNIPYYAALNLGTHAVPILNGQFDVSILRGTVILAGYGTSLGDLLNNAKYAVIYTIQ